VTADPPIRIWLSPPDVGARERELLLDAFDSGWIAPLGPHVDGFEREMAEYVGGDVHCVALSSGTAALHLALLDLGVGPGDEVLTSTMTFVATANAITYTGATPVFIDVEPETWQLDPALVAQAIEERVRTGRPPAAVVTVDLYGMPADHEAIKTACAPYGIPVVEDAAEALGATRDGVPAGRLGDVGLFSFNGNKIMTTSGGGMLVVRDAEAAARARHLATQAREPAPHYQHERIGFNYRLSNLLAAVGRGQLESIDVKVDRRRAINDQYREAFVGLAGMTLLGDIDGTRWNAWLTALTVNPAMTGTDREAIRLSLRAAGIEARPLWKPLHLQPVFQAMPMVGGAVSELLFRDGLCLPSGSTMADAEVSEVAGMVQDLVSNTYGQESV
jgi:dTDP-4-amino-4,6-dideoxygalactose transaminase